MDGFGKKIRELRLRRDMSLRDLGERSGLSYSFIGSLEKGRFKPSRETVYSLAAALNHPADELLLLAGFAPETATMEANNGQESTDPSLPDKKDKTIQGLAFIDGGVEELDEEEMDYLRESLELFRRMKERKAKEREKNK